MLKEESSVGSSMSSHSASDGKAAGKHYFNAPNDIFNTVTKQRKKGQHWKTLVGKELGQRISNHMKVTKSKSVMLRQAGYDNYIVLQGNF